MVSGALMPATRRFFRDERIVSAHPREAIYELAVRMPLATALGEELMFRSGFEALLSRRRSAKAAALISAAAFGLWHVLPTLDRVHSNPGVAETHGGSPAKQALVVAAVLGATTISSLGLSWLQRRTGSVVAPIVVHYAINASGFAAGWIADRTGDGVSDDGAVPG
jgi:membrane protease YdiL (CAAX protease family)